MRLYPFLSSLKKRIPGALHRGKVRAFEPVKLMHASKLKNLYEIEEKNMFYLRHSYLTPEQSAGHAVALGRTKQSNFVEKVLAKKKDFKDHVTVESRLAHLRCSESWE